MQITKNIFRGGKITDLNEIKRLATERKSIVVGAGYGYFVRPAAFILQWPLAMILRYSIYYSVHNSEITDVEFEEKSN